MSSARAAATATRASSGPVPSASACGSQRAPWATLCTQCSLTRRIAVIARPPTTSTRQSKPGVETGATLAELAQAAARALDMDYAGVDLLPTPDGIQVLEVNGVAAWHGLQRVASVDIARALVDDLLDRRVAAGAERRHA